MFTNFFRRNIANLILKSHSWRKALGYLKKPFFFQHTILLVKTLNCQDILTSFSEARHSFLSSHKKHEFSAFLVQQGGLSQC